MSVVVDVLAVAGALIFTFGVLLGLVQGRTAVFGGECTAPLREDVRGSLPMVIASAVLVVGGSLMIVMLVRSVIA